MLDRYKFHIYSMETMKKFIVNQCPSLKSIQFLQKTTLLGSHKKQATLNEKLVELCYQMIKVSKVDTY